MNEEKQLDLIGGEAVETVLPGGVERAPIVPQPAAPASAGGSGGRGGRKPGARNRKTVLLGKYLAAKGFRDPAVAMAEIANADPVELLHWIKDNGTEADGEVGLLEVLKLQLDQAAKLLPYLHGRITPDTVVNVDNLPVLVIESGGQVADQGRDGRMSVLDAVVVPAKGESEQDQ